MKNREILEGVLKLSPAHRNVLFEAILDNQEEAQIEFQVEEIADQVGEASAVVEKDVITLSRREICELLGYAPDMSNEVLMKKVDDLEKIGITPVPNSLEEYGGYQYYFDKSVLTSEERTAYNFGESPFARYPEITKLANQKRAENGKREIKANSLRNRLLKLAPEERAELGIIQPGGQRGSVIFRKRAFMQTSAML